MHLKYFIHKKIFTKHFLGFVTIGCVIFCCSCTNKSLIKGFDRSLWAEGMYGCEGNRPELVQVILKSRQKLMGKTEDRIISTLGKPDRNELYERNQKFYIYYLDPGPLCHTPDPDPDMLVLRFSAVGICNEVFRQKGFTTK